MTDIFISYSHEDQAFVRRMVPALEAEGFTVWWDHTIPPGKTWDTFIARGISDARCCIVVWSRHSIGSDWVKEEATLAKEASKLLPVQIDAEPPMGFRRIQAANLQTWNGDARDPQWQMLVREARTMISDSRASGVQSSSARPSYSPQPAYTPPAATPRRKSNAVAIGVTAVAGVVAAVALFVIVTRPSEQPTATTLSASTGVTDPASSTTAPPAGDSEELERLRRERDAAREAERRTAAEAERLRREAAAGGTVAGGLDAFVGYWVPIGGDCEANIIRREGSELVAGTEDWNYRYRLVSPTRIVTTEIDWRYDLMDGGRLHWTGIGGEGSCTFRRQ